MKRIGSAVPNLDWFVQKLFGFALTEQGKLILLGTGLTMLVGLVTLNVPLYHVFTTLGCLWLVTMLYGLLLRPRVDMSGGIAAKAIAGKPISGRIVLTNRSGRAAYDLSVGYFLLHRTIEQVEAPKVVPQLGPAESATFDVQLKPRRRGMYDLHGPWYYSSFPFGMFRFGPSPKSDGNLLVLPHFHSLADVDIPVGMRYQPGGIALTSHVGESPEYIGNRDFRSGDSLRRIDPRAWARLGSPVVKEYQEEYYCRVALVLDTYVAPSRTRKPIDGFADMEVGVSLAAAVADAMSRGEYILDIFAAGPDLYVFRSGRHTAHLENVLEILACVNECRKNPFDVVAPALADELNNISAVIFVLLDWDDSREHMVRTAIETGCSAKVLIVRDKPTTKPFEAAEDWAGPIQHFTSQQVRSGRLERV